MKLIGKEKRMKFRSTILIVFIVSLLLTACSSSNTDKSSPVLTVTKSSTDSVSITQPTQPIVNLVPSATSSPNIVQPTSFSIPFPLSGTWEIHPDSVDDIQLLYEHKSSIIGSVNQAVWSPEGSLLAASGSQGLVLFNGDDLSINRTLNHDQSYYHIAFSPKGTLIAAARYPYIVEIWDLSSNSIKFIIENSGDKSFFNGNGSELAVVSYDDDIIYNDEPITTTIKLYDLTSGALKSKFTEKTSLPIWTMQMPETIGVFFSQDGKSIQSVNILGDVHFWDKQTGALLNTSINSHTRERLSNGICFTSPSYVTEFVISCEIQYMDPPCTENTPGCNPIPRSRFDIGVWDINQLRRNRNLISHDPFGYLISSFYEPQTKTLVLLENEKALFLDLSKNVKEFKSYAEFLEKNEYLNFGQCINCPYSGIAYTPINNNILTVWKKGEIEIWNIEDKTLLSSFSNEISYPTSSAISEHNGLPSLAIGYSDGKIQTIDIQNQTLLKETFVMDKAIRELSFFPGSKVLYTLNNDYTIRKLELESLNINEVYPFEASSPSIKANPTSNLITLSRYDNKAGNYVISQFDVSNDTEVNVIKTNAELFAVSNDGLWIATFYNNVVLWNAETGNMLREFPFPDEGTYSGLTISPDASYLAISHDENFIVWDVNTNASFTHVSKFGKATSITFSPNGCLVAFGDYGGWVYIMDINTKIIISDWQAHNSEINDLEFSSDGRILLSQSSLGTIKLWGQEDAHLLPAGDPAKLTCKNALPPQKSTPVTPTATSTPVKSTSTQTLVTFFRQLSLTEPHMIGNDVLQMQQRLYALGYTEVGIPDGDFGQKTDLAVRNFQEKNGLVVDGIVGPITWNLLFSESAIQK